MNQVMWQNPLVQENVQKLVSLGRSVIAPTWTGIEVYSKRLELGAMPPIDAITEYLEELLRELSAPEVIAADDNSGNK
jgi:phosphopantothenoylcysteine synthetase/decarboxylase